MTTELAMWGGFIVLVMGLLLLDFLVFQRKPHAVSTREALIWTALWVSLAMVFGVGVYLNMGTEKALEFYTGYLIEEALSVDNMFVFLVIFQYFAVPAAYQHRVLFYGILGAMVMRGIFIGVGTYLLTRFAWLIVVFGALLLFTAWRLWKDRDEEYQIETNRVVVLGRKYLPLTDTYVGERFFIRREARLLVTPLFLVLITVEFTDLIFAIDSIPAIFGITTDPFIVFTSNIFAIAGLRALYFVLAGIYDKFHYLKMGLALVLGFVGLKMVTEPVLDSLFHFHIPVWISLLVVAGLIFGSILLSVLRPKPDPDIAAVEEAEAPFGEGPPVS